MLPPSGMDKAGGPPVAGCTTCGPIFGGAGAGSVCANAGVSTGAATACWSRTLPFGVQAVRIKSEIESQTVFMVSPVLTSMDVFPEAVLKKAPRSSVNLGYHHN